MGRQIISTLVAELDAEDVGYRIALEKAQARLTQLEAKVAETNRATVRMGQAGDEAGGLFSAGLSKITLGASAAGVALVAVGIKAEHMAMQIDGAMRQIGAASPALRGSLPEIQHDLESLANVAGRSHEEIRAAAEDAARLGVNSAGELKAKLEAATLLADATGENLQNVVEGVDQLSDAFQLDAGQIVQAMAKIRSAAAGRVDFSSIFQAFQTVTPRVLELGLDMETAVRAVIALLDRGFSGRKLSGFFTEHDADDIRQVAAEAKIAANAMDELKESADFKRGGADREFQRTINAWDAALAGLATKALPSVTHLLEALTSVIEKSSSPVFLRAAGNLLGLSGLGELAPAKSKEHVVSVTYQTPKRDLAGPPLPPSDADKAKFAAAEKKVEELRHQLDLLTQTANSASARSHAFAESIHDWEQAAHAAKLPIAEIDAGVAKLTGTLARFRADEETEFAASLASAVGALTGDLSQAAEYALAKQLAGMRAWLAAQDDLSDGAREFYQQQIDSFAKLSEEQIKAQRATRNLDDELQRIDFAGPTAESFVKLSAIEDGLRLALTEQTEGAAGYKIIMAAILKIDEARDKLRGKRTSAATKETTDAEKHLRTLQDQARTIQQSVDGALQLAHAFGLVDESTTNVLRSIGQVAANIPSLVAQLKALHNHEKDKDGNPIASVGSVVGAALPVVGGLATIVSGLLSASEAQKAAAEAFRQAVKEFEENTDRYITGASGNPVKDQLLSEQLRHDGLLQQAKSFQSIYELGNKFFGGNAGKQGIAKYGDDASKIDESYKQILARITSDFWGSIAEGLNALDGPAGAYRNQLAAIEKAYEEQKVSAAALGATEEQLAEIEQLHAGKLAQLKEAEAARVQSIDDNLEVRRLEALGLDDEASALRRQIEEREQLRQAVLDGWTEEEIAALKANQALEDQAAATEKVAEAARKASEELDRQRETGDEIYDTSAGDRAKEKAAQYGFDLGDISTAEGRDAAIKTLQNLYAANKGDKDLAARILATIRDLRAIDFGTPGGDVAGAATSTRQPTSSGANSFAQEVHTITIEQGSKINDSLVAILAVTRQFRADFNAAIPVGLFRAFAGTVLTPPALPVGAFAGASGSGGPVTITVSIAQNFYAPVGQVDRAAALEFAQLTLDQIDRGLAARYKRAQLFRGKIIQT